MDKDTPKATETVPQPSLLSALEALGGFLLGILFKLTAASFVIMGTWNYVMPTVFGLHEIKFIQAAALAMLSDTLFGSVYSRSNGRAG